MSKPVLVIGSYLSPYVRKVLAVLDYKGIAYQIDPIVPFYGNEAFSELSPARRIPVLIDGPLTLCDSTVIVEYLNEQYPTPSILPAAVADRARARWLEEYADSVLGDVFIWKYWNQLVINRFVWGKTPDEAIVQQTVEQDIPGILDYLEEQVPAQGLLFESLCVADIALAAMFRNLLLARYTIDDKRWPNTARYIERVHALPCFAKLEPYETLSVKVPIQAHRDALATDGAPISEQSYGLNEPRRGILSR